MKNILIGLLVLILTGGLIYVFSHDSITDSVIEDENKKEFETDINSELKLEMDNNNLPAEDVPSDTAVSESPVTPEEPEPESGQNNEIVGEDNNQIIVQDPEPEPEPEAPTLSSITIDVSGRNFEFSKDEIVVQEGQEVTINFTSTGGFHNFVIPDLGASTSAVGAGDSDSVTFMANTAGTFNFFCSIGNHREMGMEGILIVE